MVRLSQWRAQGIGTMRILFGVVWAIDAQFKWRPAFINEFVNYLTGSLAGQPPLVKGWISLWINVVKVDPTTFAYLVAITETALAIALLLGIFSNLAFIGGGLLSLVIWSTAEGLGGPYGAGSTDIGASIIYFIVFALLFFSHAGLYLGFDKWLTPRLGAYSWMASGP
jgi:thiosulfate dehydrogenase (quinone) large subunit